MNNNATNNTTTNTNDEAMPPALGYNPDAVHDAARSLILSTVANNTITNDSNNNNNNGDGAGAGADSHQEQPTTSTALVPLAEAAQASPCRATYKECQRNFAAPLGQLAHDGCGEFMLQPGVPPNCTDPDLLKCAACNCHRNFHRAADKFEGGPPQCACHGWRPEDVPLQTVATAAGGEDAGSPARPPGVGGNPPKRFRTKFTPEQKNRMVEFAHRVGWRMTRENEADIVRFCEDVNVQRRVFKIWMHNNKNTYGRRAA